MKDGVPSIEIMDKGERYILEFQSYLRTMPPVGFDYEKTIRQDIERLRKSGRKSLPCRVIASLQSTNVVDGKVEAKFFLPGHINLTHTLRFDPKIQDLSGSMGLRINCTLRKV
jgi:hypothetical protein